MTQSAPVTVSAGEHRAIVHGMIGRLAIIGITVATGVITARALGPAGRGEQAAMILWPVLLSCSTTLGLPTALSFYLKQPGANASRLVSSALTLSAVITTLAGVVTALLMPRLLGHYSPTVISGARLFLLSLPVGAFMLIARSVLEANGHFTASVKSQWAIPVLTLAILLLFLAFRVLNPVTVSIAYTVNGLPVAYWLFRKLRGIVHLTWDNPLREARQLLSYGLPAYGIDLCGTISGSIDQAMVVNFLSASAMGTYGVALSVSRMLSFCQAAVTMVLLPKAAGCSTSADVAALTERAARATLLITGVAAIAASILAPIFVRILYGPEFETAVPPFRILLVEAVIGGTVVVLAQAAMALGRPALVTSLQVCGLTVTVPLMFLLVPRFGLVGAALAILAATCVRFVLMLLSFPFLLGLQVPRLWMTIADVNHLLEGLTDSLWLKRLGLCG